MTDAISAVFQAPLTTILVVGGMTFLLIAVLGNVSGRFEPGTPGRIASGVIGLALMIFAFVIPGGDSGSSAPPVQSTGTQPQPNTGSPSQAASIGSVAPQPPAPPREVEREVEVLASESWQPSGIRIENGDSWQITYVGGVWRAAGGPTEDTDPRGSIPTQDVIGDPECRFPMLQRVAGKNALIARIGDEGEPFNPFKTMRNGAGMLFLRLNDCDKYLSDNRGAVKVRIALTR